MVKNSSIRNFLFNCTCAAFNCVLTAMAKILQNSWIVCILKLSNVLFCQTIKTYNSVCYYKKVKTHGTGIEQINCCFISAMFVFCSLCARVALHQPERAQKTVFSHLNVSSHVELCVYQTFEVFFQQFCNVMLMFLYFIKTRHFTF